MADTKLPPKTGLSFAISYGFLGGPFTGHKLRRLLRQSGCTPASNLTEADIIIAHSAGCWLVDAGARPRLIMYVGMPLAQANAKQTFGQANRRNIWAIAWHGHFLSGLQIGLCSLYYGLRQPRRNLGIIKMTKSALPYTSATAQTIFVANQYDPWPQSPRLATYLAGQSWAFIGLPGSHDNIWEQPERYVEIINHYAKLLD